MYLMRANHHAFITGNLDWANAECARLFALGFVVSLQVWGA
jgi:hypothetical protein